MKLLDIFKNYNFNSYSLFFFLFIYKKGDEMIINMINMKIMKSIKIFFYHI